jgi:hypothetical protein
MKTNKYIYIFFAALLLFTSCRSCSKKLGDKVGESVGEFSEGVAKGAEKAFDIEVNASEDLKNKGVNVGKVLLGSDTAKANRGHDNKLSVYLIFDKDYKDVVRVRVTDAKGLEIGRSKDSVDAKQGDAGYYDFYFDRRTNIDSDSKIIIE